MRTQQSRHSIIVAPFVGLPLLGAVALLTISTPASAGGGDHPYPTTTHATTTVHATTTAATTPPTSAATTTSPPTTQPATTTTPAPPPPTIATTTTQAATTTTATTLPATTTTASSATSIPRKVWVCKFVGTPGVDERLQTGQNPISVSVNAIPGGAFIGAEFADRQGRSLVIAFDDGGPEPSVDQCRPTPPTTTIPATTTTQPATTTTTSGTTTTLPTGGQFSFPAVTAICPDGETPLIAITFPSIPALNSMVGTLTFSTGGSIPLTFISGATVQVPWPASAGTGSVTLNYTVGGETATPVTLSFPEDCVPTTTTLPGTTTLPSTTLPPTTTSPTTTTPATTLAPTTTLAGATTTGPSGTTTTASLNDRSLSIGSAASVCSRDVPFIDITFGNQPEFNGLVGTITFSTLDGDFVETIPVTYQANSTVRLVYPGASFDPVTGEATDWPGWVLNDDGFWVLDPTDAEFRDGLTVTATLPLTAGGSLGQSLRPIFQQVVTATTTITYPPETALCASPEGPFGPDVPLDEGGFPIVRPASLTQLPPAGGTLTFVRLAGALVLMGVGVVAVPIAWRRSDEFGL